MELEWVLPQGEGEEGNSSASRLLVIFMATKVTDAPAGEAHGAVEVNGAWGSSGPAAAKKRAIS